MAGIRYDAQIGSWPGLLQVPSILERCHYIVAAVHDPSRDAGKPVRVRDELAVAREKTAVDEVVAFDAGEGDRIIVGAEIADALGVAVEGEGRRLPDAPGLRRLELDL